ncbi:MAG: HDOD domain-containing protein [Cellvibrionaceae bacterium]|nr:HDOD domain-containing protein [Cellvibrionaceae bacterium]
MSFDSLFSQTYNIPSIPKLVQELIDNFSHEDSNTRDIAKKLQMDQALSAKVLRLANSARYGAGRNINSIDSAVIILGFNSLKTLVIASGLTSASKNIPGLNQKKFWRTSFSVANIAKLLAKLAHQDGDVAFTCGMLHNIGDTLLFLAHRSQMQNIAALAATGVSKSTLEQTQFGCNYMDVGAELARRWNFPPGNLRGNRQPGASGSGWRPLYLSLAGQSGDANPSRAQRRQAASGNIGQSAAKSFGRLEN